MFGRKDFRENGKIQREKMRRENVFRRCLIRRREGKKMMEPECFLSKLIKKVFTQNWEKIGQEEI